MSLTKLLVLCGLALAALIALAVLLLGGDDRASAEGTFPLVDLGQLDHREPG